MSESKTELIALPKQVGSDKSDKDFPVRQAIRLFNEGRYREAKDWFEKASAAVSSRAFSANVRLCNARIKTLNSQYGEIRKDFYGKGAIAEVVAFLERLDRAGELKRDKNRSEFSSFVYGLHHLRDGWSHIPPRQPNPGHFPIAKSVLYCLHQSVPNATNGYSTRSHGVAKGLLNAGFRVHCVTRPGFPWDTVSSGVGKGCHEQIIDNISYYAEAGWPLNKTPLDHYLAQAADLFFRRAQLTGSELIVAASNHITGLPALMAARRLGVPFVYEVRGLWEVTQASVQPDWNHSDRFRLMRTLEQQVCKEADQIITITDELSRELQAWGVRADRISIVPNAVDINAFPVAEPDPEIIRELGLRHGTPVIGYAGSIVAYEGLELLIEALALMKQRGQDFVFVLVGDGKAFESVKNRATALSISEQCRFVGRVAFDQVQRYISCMEIMPVPRLSSSVTEMVSALKPLEAMAMGKAVVLSDVSPHRPMAGENAERALLFEKDSAASLSAALQHLIDHPSDRQRLGLAARAWIEHERTWNQVTNRYADALKRVTQQHRAADSTLEAKGLEQITIGLIADQFTTDTLVSALRVVPLSPENWQAELDAQPLDAVLIESAWKGNQGQWYRKVGFYSEEEFAPLQALLTACRERCIPSLFWNKEDPVHFDRFRRAASLCDHVFTTDSRRIIPYLVTHNGKTKTASSCPFYASPKLHNLLPSTRQWQATAAYGGTYYGKRYPERSEYMDKIMSAAAPLGLTIYDRQQDDSESPYKYPGGLHSYVVGSLSYKEMIQAYKAHPVQINVNSVLDSPTMFSRRVMEASACGTPIISGPSRGMNHYLNGAIHVVETETEAAQALENLLLQPEFRCHIGLKAARSVMRCHTAEHRLTQMLRTAGIKIKAPDLPKVRVIASEITEQAAQCLASQTLLPTSVSAKKWHSGAMSLLVNAGIPCHHLDPILTTSTEQDSLYLLSDFTSLEDLGQEDLEDIAWPTLYTQSARIGIIRTSGFENNGESRIALLNHPLDSSIQLIHYKKSVPLNELMHHAKKIPTIGIRIPHRKYKESRRILPKKLMVIAGHDFKFIKSLFPYFSNNGFRLLLDFWSGHNIHDDIASQRLVQQADIIFCEWMLGNAMWYAKHKKPGQKLIGRLHLQEIDHKLFDQIPFSSFDKVIFVAHHILRKALAKKPKLALNSAVIFNGVDTKRFESAREKTTNGKVLGLVGIVPQRKRLDIALDILKELRKDDKEYVLRIKGKQPCEYTWMKNRPSELAWYQIQYTRIQDDPYLRDSVVFDPHGNDMCTWYSKVNFVLSTSDFESFHFTIPDGVSAGCIPVIMPWEGASEIYPTEWVSADISSAVKRIQDHTTAKHLDIKFVKERFSLEIIAKQIINEVV